MHTIEAVKQIYAAFGRDDVPAILERLAEDVQWEYGYRDHVVPWLEPRAGRAGAAAFFQAAHTELEFLNFAVTHVVGDASVVVALIDLDARVRKTGKVIQERGEAHIWHFDAAGRIHRFRHGADTLQQWRAWQP